MRHLCTPDPVGPLTGPGATQVVSGRPSPVATCVIALLFENLVGIRAAAIYRLLVQ
ncbi:hypothetical protein ACFQ5D_23950 [Paenibacillus farraposensis]|uniref:Uncharacterized protein n=1 Tax=Paenibacillus farraposensis TaxID=2807095 RepID=A0ABW4DJU8_9BACL